MSAYKQKSGYLIDTEEGESIKVKLQAMVGDKIYNTASTYSSNTTLYADNLVSFVEKHMHYLNTHPQLDPRMYLANLRLMTRVR